MSEPSELIDPVTIMDMSHQELEEWVSAIRLRRSRVVIVVRKTKTAIAKSSDAAFILVLTRKCKQLDKLAEKLTAQLEKAETLVNEIVSIRLQLGDETPDQLADEMREASLGEVDEAEPSVRQDQQED